MFLEKVVILPYFTAWVTLITMGELLNNIWSVYLDTATWLLVGLMAAGFVKAFIPEDAMKKWLGGSGLSAIGRASLFGAPLPLCSCGVLPAALGLRRAGASKEATVSFLISTPETSIDSVAVTYALMGPLMAIYRPFAALASAFITGIMVAFVKDEPKSPETIISTEEITVSCCGNKSEISGCSEPVKSTAESSCCGSALSEEVSKLNKLKQALYFAGAELLDDISKWMAFGIIFAGFMVTVIPEGWLAQWGHGFLAMMVMLLVGIPMYICASASTPVAAGLLVAGVSPGAVLVFLLVGPATNIAGLMLVKQELGSKVTLIYLTGIAFVSVIMGLLLEWLLTNFQLEIETSMQQQTGILPYELSLFSAILLLVLVVPAIRNRVIPFYSRV